MKDVPSMCPVSGCSRTYTNKFNLKHHMEAFHSEFSQFQCIHCYKVLSSKQTLREHQFIHTNEKPYQCKEPSCQLRFRQGSQLSAHKRIHVAMRSVSRTDEMMNLNVIDS